MNTTSPSRSLAVIGAGAVGAFYGAKLQQAGWDVEYQSARSAELLAYQPLCIDSIWGSFSIPVHCFKSSSQMKPADVVLVCVKALPEIDYRALLSPVVKRDGIIVLLQNGINLDEKLARLFPDCLTVGAAAFTCINREQPYLIRHLAYGRVEMGIMGNRNDGRLPELVQAFKTAGIECGTPGPLRLIRWKKLLWNVPFNTLSVLLGASTLDMMNDPKIVGLVTALMQEVASIARADGYRLDDGDIQKMLDNTRAMVPYKTSMLLDFEASRPMECDAVVGEALNCAKNHRLNAPLIAGLFAQLCFINDKNLNKE